MFLSTGKKYLKKCPRTFHIFCKKKKKKKKDADFPNFLSFIISVFTIKIDVK